MIERFFLSSNIHFCILTDKITSIFNWIWFLNHSRKIYKILFLFSLFFCTTINQLLLNVICTLQCVLSVYEIPNKYALACMYGILYAVRVICKLVILRDKKNWRQLPWSLYLRILCPGLKFFLIESLFRNNYRHIVKNDFDITADLVISKIFDIQNFGGKGMLCCEFDYVFLVSALCVGMRFGRSASIDIRPW